MKINPDFNFFGFKPTEEVRNKANLVAERLLDLAPYGSMMVAVLEKTEGLHQCSIDIYSKNGPFKVSASHQDPMIVLEKVHRSLMRKLNRWKKLRGTVKKSSRFRLFNEGDQKVRWPMK